MIQYGSDSEDFITYILLELRSIENIAGFGVVLKKFIQKSKLASPSSKLFSPGVGRNI